ncbi:hypothetical protein GQ42DRAFT_165737 [Ramicandelaber brevisporus]|nr:hypothetical protein GQ42DRAFT_165737 [Ramicandelaber brevisporus]
MYKYLRVLVPVRVYCHRGFSTSALAAIETNLNRPGAAASAGSGAGAGKSSKGWHPPERTVPTSHTYDTIGIDITDPTYKSTSQEFLRQAAYKKSSGMSGGPMKSATSGAGAAAMSTDMLDTDTEAGNLHGPLYSEFEQADYDHTSAMKAHRQNYSSSINFHNHSDQMNGVSEGRIMADLVGAEFDDHASEGIDMYNARMDAAAEKSLPVDRETLRVYKDSISMNELMDEHEDLWREYDNTQAMKPSNKGRLSK